jgi:LemA protein
MGVRMTAMIAIAIACLAYVLWAYNRLVVHRNRIRNAWAQIDVQLHRRSELVPNLVACVKGTIAHEREVLKSIAEMRRQTYIAGSDIAARALAENYLARSLSAVTAEAAPQLRANQNFLALQEELRSSENRIAFARQHYNDCVMRYNAAVSSLPTNLVARLFAFGPATMLQASGSAAG